MGSREVGTASPRLGRFDMQAFVNLARLAESSFRLNSEEKLASVYGTRGVLQGLLGCYEGIVRDAVTV